MSYMVEVEVENTTGGWITSQIPKGTVFEPSGLHVGVQCLVAEQTIVFKVPPYSTQIVQVPALCMNSDLAGPNSVPGALTPYKLTTKFESQKDVWEHVNGQK